MKIVIQRVLRASVTSNSEVVGSIGKGMSVLVGICQEDTREDMDYVIRKILGVRLWSNEDETKRWCRNVREIEGGVLLISQFTLMHVMKGNKPDFHHAMNPDKALEMFNELRDKLSATYVADRVATGKFQNYMNIEQVMDGPVTLVLDSKNKE
ncbi:D-tyrosyl-tRNA(Tyr) deacylase [Strigomonas culicis]|uniref:D-aminoacyl-tRNA deacylase n=2 Tax=Strigomonas culicis TaxID=28005 RepID=S9UNA9_9TRYP|nr:D-tyrosyl-tRNA(Tyr) deacylase [Strigomonas culicis]|eukprot:EPY32352.1 D-tyrosyl-tRNA(Tyr) deacylase [Strigomonas culicis]